MKPCSLLALSSLLALVSCVPEAAPGDTALTAEAGEALVRLERDIQKTKAEALLARSQLRMAEEDRNQMAAAHAERQSQLQKLRTEIDTLHDEFAAYRHEYRRSIQSRAAGMKLPGFTARSRHYGTATVTSLNDSEVALLVDSGVVRLPLAELPPDLQALLGYDPTFRAPEPPRLLAAPDSRPLDEAIAAGKRAAAENQRLLMEMRAARERKRNQPPAYLRASPPPGKRIPTSFEGSYWAPYNK